MLMEVEISQADCHLKVATVWHADCAGIIARAAPDRANVKALGVHRLPVSAVKGDTVTEHPDRTEAQIGQQMAMSLLQVGNVSHGFTDA